jgi:hypothetical protein
LLASCVCHLVKSKGKPDAGNPPVRFDEGEGASLPTLLYGIIHKTRRNEKLLRQVQK